MTIEHTSRTGKTYYPHVKPTTGGKPSYFRAACVATWLLLLSACLAAAPVAEPRQIDLPNGGRITVLVAQPVSAGTNGSPLCILLPGGPGTEDMARSALSGIGREFVSRGWVVAAPVSPDGRPFFGRNGLVVPDIVKAMQADPAAEGGQALLAGLSNGGIAAFEVAARDPALFLGVVALPGVVWRQSDLKGLKGMPVFLRIGAKDELGWGQSYQATTDRLAQAGAIVDAKLVPETGHGVKADWVELDRWLKASNARAAH